MQVRTHVIDLRMCIEIETRANKVYPDTEVQCMVEKVEFVQLELTLPNQEKSIVQALER